MFKTKNSFNEASRHEIVSLLQKYLASTIDLTLQTKQAHWNIKGPNFIGLHELFDKVHEQTEICADMIAERIAQFGGIATGTCQSVVKNTLLIEYPSKDLSTTDHLDFLTSSLAELGEQLRYGITNTTKMGDPATADILTEALRGIDKNLWFVERHLSDSKTVSMGARGAA